MVTTNKMQLTAEGFNDHFEMMLKANGGQVMKAYEAAEEWHELFFGKKRYSDYDSFQRVRGRALKKE